VEGLHDGQGDSSVLYIPAVPLTIRKRVPARRSFLLTDLSLHTVQDIFEISESTLTAAFLPRKPRDSLHWNSLRITLVTSDFPGGEGESRFLNRGGKEHIQGETGHRALGFKKFDVPQGASPGEAQAIFEANKILFPETSG
jgi:hypothetical protein